MTGLLIGFAVGGLFGTAVTVLAYELRRRRSVGVDELTDDDREVITRQFAEHSASMRHQVMEFADKLAGDDPVLRERLRRFETGDVA